VLLSRYGFGANGDHRLGLATSNVFADKLKVSEPQLIGGWGKKPPTWEVLAAGTSHSVAVTTAGEVWVWG
jgi:alpha-tubulin suppressor-like RCC1 family protein